MTKRLRLARLARRDRGSAGRSLPGRPGTHRASSQVTRGPAAGGPPAVGRARAPGFKQPVLPGIIVIIRPPARGRAAAGLRESESARTVTAEPPGLRVGGPRAAALRPDPAAAVQRSERVGPTLATRPRRNHDPISKSGCYYFLLFYFSIFYTHYLLVLSINFLLY